MMRFEYPNNSELFSVTIFHSLVVNSLNFYPHPLPKTLKKKTIFLLIDIIRKKKLNSVKTVGINMYGVVISCTFNVWLFPSSV